MITLKKKFEGETMNFTEEIKDEIMENGFNDRSCALAALSAFIRTSGSIVVHGGIYGFELVTENEKTADFFFHLIEENFGFLVTSADTKSDLMSGKDKFVFEVVNEQTTSLLKELGILVEDETGVFLSVGIQPQIVEKEDCLTAYIKGAFLGGGSCTIPEEGVYSSTGYHLEFIFTNKTIASDFCILLCDIEILAKLVYRKESTVVYVKSKEVISDFLAALSVNDCLNKLNKIVEIKDKTNHDNRVNNCSVSNIDKTLTASANQVMAIEVIRETIGLQRLTENLFEVAEARLADTNASMQELADRLHISKSCINHRMRKILELAKQLN
jgi:hypothetical protein